MRYRLKYYNDNNELVTYKLSFYDSDSKALVTEYDKSDGVETLWDILSSLLSKKSNDSVLLYRGVKYCGVLTYDMIEQFEFSALQQYYKMRNISNSPTTSITSVYFLYGFNTDRFYHAFLIKKYYDSISSINYYQDNYNYANSRSIQYNSKETSLDIYQEDAFFDIIKYYPLNNKTVNIHADENFIKHVGKQRFASIPSNNCTLVFDYKPIDFNSNTPQNAHIVFNDSEEEIWTDKRGVITKTSTIKKDVDINQHALIVNDTKCGIYDSSSNTITIDEGFTVPILGRILLELPKSNNIRIITKEHVDYIAYSKIKSVKIPNTYTYFNDVFGDGTCITAPIKTDRDTFTDVIFVAYDRLKKFYLIDSNSGLNNSKITEDKLYLNTRLFSIIIENNNVPLPNLRFLIFGEHNYPRQITGTNNCTFIYYDNDSYQRHCTTARDQLYALPLHSNKNYKITTIPAIELYCYVNEYGIITEKVIDKNEK